MNQTLEVNLDASELNETLNKLLDPKQDEDHGLDETKACLGQISTQLEEMNQYLLEINENLQAIRESAILSDEIESITAL